MSVTKERMKDSLIPSREFDHAMKLLVTSLQQSSSTLSGSTDLIFDKVSYLLETIQKPTWSLRPRIYLVLHIIGRVDVMDNFVDEGILDIHFPFTEARLPAALDGFTSRHKFIETQSVVLTMATNDLANLEGGQHRNFATDAIHGFICIKQLGSGKFGTVDLVRSKLSLTEYALKRMSRAKTFSKDRTAIKIFKNELKTLKRLEHRHLVKVIGSFTDPQYVGLLILPVADCDLKAFLEQQSFEQCSLLRQFFGCLCSAVQYLHSQKCRHKDLKPGNILIKSNTVFITDFGTAWDWSDLSRGTTVGKSGPYTPRYAAPEVTEWEARNESSDIWSLGCVFLDILTVLKGRNMNKMVLFFQSEGTGGQNPGTNRVALEAWLLQLEHTSSSDNQPIIWIQQMLQQEPRQRITATTLLNEILDYEDDHIYYGFCCGNEDSEHPSGYRSSAFVDDSDTVIAPEKERISNLKSQDVPNNFVAEESKSSKKPTKTRSTDQDRALAHGCTTEPSYGLLQECYTVRGQKLNLLSLDGGGVRGLSSLYILQRLMEAVNPDKPPKPCDYFDMIAGTSTGGLIAIMLGRLKMDVQQCIDAYRGLSDQVFKRRRRIPFSIGGKICERFDSKELEMAIKKVLVKQGYHKDTLLKEPGATCRVFVCATSDRTGTIVPLRSYSSKRGSAELYDTTKIWEAGRATSAASTFFDFIAIGPSKQRFFDRSNGANNPVRQLWNEAKDVWLSASFERNIGCIVSIGTGVPSLKEFGKDGLEIFETLKHIATETEATARDFHQEHTALDDSDRYFRFNAPDGLANVGSEEMLESSTIVDGTQYYLANELVHKQVRTCAKALGEREVSKVIALRETPNPDDLQLFLALSKRPEWNLALQEGVPSFNIFDRVSDYEPDRTYRNYLRNRCEGTTNWILHHEMFLAWFERKSHPCLWLSGKIGCGKTLITSTVVQHLIQESLKAGDLVAHFFFSHSNKTRLEATHLFQSHIKQILGYLYMTRNPCPSRIVSYVKQFYGYKRYPPSFVEVIDEIFLPLSALLPSATYVVDGLDECEPEQVREILKTFQKMGSQRGPRIFISGREALDVASSIPGSNTIRISEECHKEDIRKFINWKIEEKMRERKLTEDERVLQDIKSKLNKRADRMILWVSLQLDALWDDCFTDADIRKALANLPKDLGETYARCLTKKSVQQSRFAPKILRWVCAAIKPFKIDQLREALAIDPKTGCLCRDELPSAQEVLKCCSNLITQNNNDQVLLAHHSVRQFLESQPADAQLLPNGFERNTAELELGQLCVMHLTSSDYSLALQPSNASRGLTMQFSSTAVEIITEPVQTWMRPFFPKPRPVQISLPLRSSRAPHATEVPSFFSLAKEQWAFLTHSIDEGSDCWPNFRTLALEPNFSWRWHPWEPIGQSLQSHYCGLLGWAIVNQHLPLLHTLLTSQEVRANTEIFNLPLYHYGNLPVLHLASRTGNISIVELLTLCDPKKIDNNRRTALHHAADVGCTDIAVKLVGRRVSKDAKDENGDTALEIAARNGHQDIVRFLVGLGVHTNAKRREMIMSKGLSLAAMNGHNDTVRVLADLGADIRGKDDNEWTALHWAASSGHETTVWTLIKLGADVNKEADFKADDSKREMPPRLKSLNKFLTQEGGVKSTCTPLWLAIENGHPEVFQHLAEVGANRNLITLKGHSGGIGAVAFSPDGRLIASGSADRTVKLWGTTTGLQATLKGHSDWVRGVAFSSDGKLVASASDDMTVVLWDTATATVQATLKGHSEWVWSVAFSPDGKLVASASDDMTVVLWDTATATVQATLKGHSGRVWSVAFSPDGKLVASASRDRTVVLWDTATATVQATLKGHSRDVLGVAFSPDGKLVASASEDMTVVLWDTATATVQATLKGHSDWVWGVAFSPDGKLVASASEDMTAVLWDTATATVQATLEGHSRAVWGIAFSPDGKLVASASEDNIVKLWLVGPRG